MKRAIHGGATSKTCEIVIQNTSSTTGAGLTGLTASSSGLQWYYHREGASSAVGVPIVSGVLGTWSSGGFCEVNSSGMQGHYEIGLPNAAIASGATYVTMQLSGATNMPPVPIEIQLDSIDYSNATNFGMTALGPQNELASVPTLPTDPITMLTWLFERAHNLSKTSASQDTIFKINATTPMGSSILTDDGTTFTRGQYQ